MRRTTLTALLATAALGTAPAAALAGSADVIKDCQDGAITGKHSQKDYSEALRNIPTDVDEYTDCRDVISRARLGGAGGGGGGAGGDGAAGGTAGGGGIAGAGGAAAASEGLDAEEIIAASSPKERAALQDAIRGSGSDPVVVGDRSVSPDTAGLSPAGAANVVPTPLVVALVLLALALTLGATQLIRTRVLARRDPAA